MEIVQARPDQSDALTAICVAAKSHWGYSREVLATWQSDLTISPDSVASHPTYIAMLNGEYAGFYQLWLDALSATLEHLWVQPDSMGKGVGRALLQHAQGQAKTALLIDSDPHAEAFYIACGARRVARIPAPIPQQPDRFLPRMELPF